MQNFLLRWNMEGCSRSGCACEDCEALCEEEVMTGFLRGLQSYSQSALMMAVPMCDSGIRWRPFFFATSPILLNLAACTIKGQTRLSRTDWAQNIAKFHGETLGVLFTCRLRALRRRHDHEIVRGGVVHAHGIEHPVAFSAMSRNYVRISNEYYRPLYSTKLK